VSHPPGTSPSVSAPETPPTPIDPAINLVSYTDLPAPVDWSRMFGNENPVELEVGSGKGLFLANEGLRRPGTNFFGIEIARKYAVMAARRVAKKGLANVRVLPGDALLFLNKYTPPASLAAVHVYFPDPWWKLRHRKRRVFREELALDLEKVLKPGADLWIATDVEEYYQVMLKLMLKHPLFVPQPPPEANLPEHELDYLTNFERKYRIEGRPIHRAHYRLSSNPVATTPKV
jgi:tRNA (guanine-N7-)-methyltransferase